MTTTLLVNDPDLHYEGFDDNKFCSTENKMFYTRPHPSRSSWPPLYCDMVYLGCEDETCSSTSSNDSKPSTSSSLSLNTDNQPTIFTIDHTSFSRTTIDGNSELDFSFWRQTISPLHHDHLECLQIIIHI